MTAGVKSTSIPNQKLNKTCSKCRKSKLKCSGGSPCERCKKLSFDCEYLACKPRSKSAIAKPKFYRLQIKEKRLNSVFDKVDEHYQLTKYYNCYSAANNLDSSSSGSSGSTSDIEDKGGVFEFLIAKNLKQLYLQAYSNNFSNIEKNNFKKDLAIGLTLENAKQQFFKLLFELYETNSCYIFTYKAFEKVLEDKNWVDSTLANAIFGMGLRIYQSQNEEPPNSPNPFYERARYLFSRITDVNTLECAQVLLIFSYTEFALGLFSKSTYSVNQAQRIALTLGLDKLCYEMDKNFTSTNIEGALVWICCLLIDIMQTCDNELPLFVSKNSIELSLTLPNISIEEFLSKPRDFQLYIQMKLNYLLSVCLSQLKRLYRRVGNPKFDHCQLDYYNELLELYERLQYYESSGWFYPHGYTLQASDYQDSQMLFAQFHRTMMLKTSYISVCGSILRIRSNNLDLFSIPSGFSNPYTCLFKYQDCIQKSIMDVLSFFYKLKNNPTPGYAFTDRLLYFSTPTSAFALTGACEYLTRDLSPFGKSCFEFFYLEAQKQAKIWPIVKIWVQGLEKHYNKHFRVISSRLDEDSE